MIVVSVRECPEAILARTRNAASAKRRAEAAGWRAIATFAIGGDEDAPVQSVVLRLGRGPDMLMARWTGPIGQDALNFEIAWHWGHGQLNWTEFSWAIDGDGSKPLTAAAQKALDQDQAELLAAMGFVSAGLGARPMAVIPNGSKSRWCQGTVMRAGGGLPAMKMKCINPVAFGDNLCPGPCRSSVEG